MAVGQKQDERMHIMMEKFWGTKEATSSVWRCTEQTGPPLFLTPWSGGLQTLTPPPPPTPHSSPLFNELIPLLLLDL